MPLKQNFTELPVTSRHAQKAMYDLRLDLKPCRCSSVQTEGRSTQMVQMSELCTNAG